LQTAACHTQKRPKGASSLPKSTGGRERYQKAVSLPRG
jgi:hypothetical protein